MGCKLNLMQQGMVFIDCYFLHFMSWIWWDPKWIHCRNS